jgi:competence ComEA-like helix-hairpin-helix protein
MLFESRPLLAFVALTSAALASAVTFGIDRLDTPKPIIISNAVVAQPQPSLLNVTTTSNMISQDPLADAAVGAQAASSAEAPSSRKRKRRTGRSSRKKSPTSIVHLNSATVEDLEELPGVGPSTAQRIIDFRTQSGGFQSVDELGDVPRIGAKKLTRIMPYVAL